MPHTRNEPDDLPCVIEVLDRVVAVLSRSDGLAEHFADSIRWLERRRTLWASRGWRVGLIGITSSGKSTLVNALLDARVLPVKVRPSSNSLVVCRSGEKPEATVFFKDGHSETLCEGVLAAKLHAYADEASNPNNEKGVDEIELRWPGFRLGPDVTLVDTPGLDAYGLDRHEELTMRLFLPTVDAVVFLTTAKANADGRIAEYLDAIGDQKKPLVLVQNMIDTVEPKLGLGGAVIETKREVADGHLRRLRRLLTSRGSGTLRSAPIVQVSAQWALQPDKVASSGVPELVTRIQEHLAALAPRFAAGRRAQLAKELGRLAEREEAAGDVAELRKLERKEQALLERIAERVADLSSGLDEGLEKVQEAARKRGKDLCEAAKSLDSSEVAEARAVAVRAERWLERLPGELAETADGLLVGIRRVARSLNLREEDLRFEMARAPSARSVTVHVDQWAEAIQVRTPGWGQGFLRLVRIGGYTTRTVNHQAIDVGAFAKEIRTHVERELDWVEGALETVRKSAKGYVRELRAEVRRREQGLEELRSSRIEASARIETAAALTSLASELGGSRRLPAVPATVEYLDRVGVQMDEKDFEAPIYVESLVRLADLIARKQNLALRCEVLARAARKSPGAERRALLWGFDGDALLRFISRYWFDLVAVTNTQGACFRAVTGAHPFDVIAVGIESELEGVARELAEGAESVLRESTTLFVLVDVDQPGSAAKQLSRSVLANASPAALVVVAQSLKGLLGSKDVGAGLLELRGVLRELDLRPDAVLVNDDQPAFSVLADRLLCGASGPRTYADEQRWMSEIGDLDTETVAVIASTLRAWRSEERA